MYAAIRKWVKQSWSIVVIVNYSRELIMNYRDLQTDPDNLGLAHIAGKHWGGFFTSDVQNGNL